MTISGADSSGPDIASRSALPLSAFSGPEADFFRNGGHNVQNATTSASHTVPSKPKDPFDAMTAKAYLVGNVATGKIYTEKSADVVMPVASMSKLVTALVATATLAPTTTIAISEADAEAPPDGSGVGAGESYQLSQILYAMLLDSSNIAAEAIADAAGRTDFLEKMSSYAWEIGMSRAYFADPSGVDPHNEASAEGIFSLARYLYRSRPDILAITRVPHIAVATSTSHGAHQFDSIHPFVSDPRFIGGKTGRTPEAGETMLTILRIGGEPVAFIVMGSSYGARAADTDILVSAVTSGRVVASNKL